MTVSAFLLFLTILWVGLQCVIVVFDHTHLLTYYKTKQEPNTEPPQSEQQEAMNQQQQNHHFRTDSSLSHWGEGGLNAFYRYLMIALDSVVV